MNISEIEKHIKESYWNLLSEKGKKEIKDIAETIMHQYPSYCVEAAVSCYYENMRISHR